MSRCAALLLLLMLGNANASEVLVNLHDGKLAARINGMSFPANLPKELTSGLTNRLYVRVSLLDAKTIAAQRAIEIAIRYDLWDQKFLVVNTMDGVAAGSRELASLEEVNTALQALPLPGLFDLATLPGARVLTLRIEVLLNPIDQEKMRMIRKWVSQNSTPGSEGRQGVSMSNIIFNRIFEQYAEGSDVAAAWRATVESAPFRIDSLKNERR